MRGSLFILQVWVLITGCYAAAVGQRSGHRGLNFGFPNSTLPERFYITVDQDFIHLTLRKVRDYRPSPGLFSNWTIEGPPESAMTNLANYWAKEYSWRDVEKKINRDNEHYATTVPGNGNYTAPIPLHFVHQRSSDSAATPLLLLHGWSSTYLEWPQAIKPLTDSGNKSFHIVAVDIPGFGFSPAATQPGLGPREMGVAFDALMQQLGYGTYGIVTTDLGWAVGMWMVQDVRDSIIGHFTDYFFAPIGDSDLARQARNETTDEENEYIAASNEWFSKHAAYITAHTQKPQLVSLGLTDSPVGFAGWLWDLKYASSDGYPYSYEEIITDTMMTWIQPPYHSIRDYQQILEPGVLFPKSDMPTGVTQWGNIHGPFPTLAKFNLAPLDWIERTTRVVYFKRYAFGGHFPAINCPNLWVEDVRNFFSGL